MVGPFFPMRVPLLAAIRAFRGVHRARLVIIGLWATGLMSVPFAAEGQGLGLVDAPICVGCAAVNSAAVSPDSGERDDGYSPLAYATPEDDAVARTEDAITINDARPFEAPAQISLHRFLQPYEVIKPFDRHAVQSRSIGAAPNKEQPAGRAPPAPNDIGVTGTTRSPFAGLPRVFTTLQPSLNPAPADAAQLADRAVVKDPNVEIIAADEVNSIDLAADPRVPGQATTMTTSQNVSPQAAAVIAGALAGAAVGLFLISWLEIGGMIYAGQLMEKVIGELTDETRHVVDSSYDLAGSWPSAGAAN
jgi:hypothetical protein